MLCGVKDLFVFHWNGTDFIPNSDIRVFHLTDVCAVDHLCLSEPALCLA